jgi:hypothetical protein
VYEFCLSVDPWDLEVRVGFVRVCRDEPRRLDVVTTEVYVVAMVGCCRGAATLATAPAQGRSVGCKSFGGVFWELIFEHGIERRSLGDSAQCRGVELSVSSECVGKKSVRGWGHFATCGPLASSASEWRSWRLRRNLPRPFGAHVILPRLATIRQ